MIGKEKNYNIFYVGSIVSSGIGIILSLFFWIVIAPAVSNTLTLNYASYLFSFIIIILALITITLTIFIFISHYKNWYYSFIIGIIALLMGLACYIRV